MVTEYHYHEEDDFVLETQYFTLADIENQFTQLLDEYRRFHLHKDELKSAETPESDFKGAEKRARIAQKTFDTVFRGTDHFPQQHRLLPSSEDAKKALLNGIRNLYPTNEPGTNVARERFEKRKQCSQRILELTSEKISPTQPARWPLIQKVT